MDDSKRVMVMFVDGYYMKARAALVTQAEMKQAALTVEGVSVEGYEFTPEETSSVEAAVAALFREPRNSVTIISHIWSREYWEVLQGRREVMDFLPTGIVVRALADAEYVLHPEVYARAETSPYDADHTVIFLEGDGR